MIAKGHAEKNVRTHDFLAYFRSHMMTLCLVFWFVTISATATGVTIYLIKKLEAESRQNDQKKLDQLKTTASSGRGVGGHDDDKDYEHYNVLDFLMDAFYAEEESVARNRSREASAQQRQQPGITAETSTDYDYGANEYPFESDDGVSTKSKSVTYTVHAEGNPKETSKPGKPTPTPN